MAGTDQPEGKNRFHGDIPEIGLNNSEELFRYLINYAGFVVVQCDLNARVRFINDMGLQYGFPRFRDGRDNTGRHLSEIWGPEMYGMFAEGLRKTIEKGKDLELELSRRGQKDTRWFWARYNLLRDTDGMPESVLFFSHDITKQKQAEVQLKESEENFRELVKASGVLVARFDTGCRFEFINDEGLHVLGLAHDQVIGKHVKDVLGEDLGERFVSSICQILQTGQSLETVDEVRFGDRIRWFWSHGGLIKDRDGNAAGVALFSRDVTEEKTAQTKLAQSEEIYRQLVETAGLVMAIWDLEGRMLFVNNLGADYLRCRSEDVLGKHITEVFGPVLGKTFLDVMQKIVTQGYDDDHVTEMPLPAGVRWFWSKGSLLRDSYGKPASIALFARDVTENVLAQQKLAQSEARYRDLIDKSGLAVTYHDNNGRIILVNNLAAGYLGGRPEDFVGKLMSEIVGPPTGQMMDRAIWDVIQTGRDTEIENELSLPVGRRFIHARFTVVRDEHDAVSGVVVFAQDHTEQTIAQQALQESETRKRMLFSMSQEAIFMHEDGVLLEANPRYFEMFGYTPEELIGKQARDITLTPESLQAVIENIRSGANRRLTVTCVRKDGSQFQCEIFGRDIVYKGRKVRIAMGMDVSERLKAEAELAEIREKMATAERLAAIGYVGATMAHEINTPLSVMRLNLQLLIADFEKKKALKGDIDKAQAILLEIDRASEIVRRYREMSRPARQVSDDVSEIREIPQRVARVFSELAHRARIRIVIGDEVPELLTRLRSVNDAEQLMFILVQNAVQAADSRKREVLNITGCIRDNIVELKFADNCRGIPPENLSKIFEPFFSTKPRNIGTGLGLSIVRRLLQERGGNIKVESEVGKGTTFIVTYPA